MEELIEIMGNIEECLQLIVIFAFAIFTILLGGLIKWK